MASFNDANIGKAKEREALDSKVVHQKGGEWYFHLRDDPFQLLPDGWYKYDPESNRRMERLLLQFNKRSSTSAIDSKQFKKPRLMMAGRSYEIDFLRGVQRNTATLKERPIFRTTHPHQPFGADLPGVEVNKGPKTIVVDPKATAHSLEMTIRQTLAVPPIGNRFSKYGVDVVSLEKIENDSLLHKFENQKREMVDKGIPSHEAIVFHISHINTMEKIVDEGLKLNKDVGGIFSIAKGKGGKPLHPAIYFAPAPRYCYDVIPGSAGHRIGYNSNQEYLELLVCKVLPGRSKELKPREVFQDRTFDTSYGNEVPHFPHQEGMVLAVYDESAVLPLYWARVQKRAPITETVVPSQQK